jgi:Flp pilus assembly protein TadG
MAGSMNQTKDSRPQPVSSQMKSRKRGSAIVEFAIVAPLLILTLFGTVSLGIMLGRTVQVNQVCRDLAHMFVDGVDFTQTANQNLAVQLAQGTGMTANGGNGVVIFSRVMTVYQADCDAAGYSGSCGSLGQCVIVQRVVVGNSSLRASAFATPTPALMDASGNIAGSVYLQNTDPSVQTVGLAGLLTAAGEVGLIPQGSSVWITEVFFTAPDLSFLGVDTSGGAYARFIF